MTPRLRPNDAGRGPPERYLSAMRLIPLVLALWAAPALADPEPYRLDAANSRVAFGYMLAGQPARGEMPVQSADIVVDLEAPASTRVTAVLDTTRADAGLFLATEAMRGPQVLDTAAHPTITFATTRVRADGFTAEIDGTITIRGVTRPITLDAQLFRQQGTDAGERDKLSIRMTGALSRTGFGADGFPDLVGDRITLDILVRIDRVR